MSRHIIGSRGGATAIVSLNGVPAKGLLPFVFATMSYHGSRCPSGYFSVSYFFCSFLHLCFTVEGIPTKTRQHSCSRDGLTDDRSEGFSTSLDLEELDIYVTLSEARGFCGRGTEM